jgi:amidase
VQTGAGATSSEGLVGLGAAELCRAIRRREISVAAVMTAYLDQIDGLNQTVNALVAIRDRAILLAEAAALDRLLAQGESPGPLFGLPLAPKDLQATRGIPTTQGSPIFARFVPVTDSLMVRRLRQAGAILIGKTNVPEFGLGSHTYNPVYGPTANAYDQTCSAGGSSGGAAVALALRMLPVADGSDYGGSLRNPAGWNNVYGLRPSYGRVPGEGPAGFLSSMSVDGPMARSVEDLALLLSVQAGYHAASPYALTDDPGPYAGSLAFDVRGIRIAWGGDLGRDLPFEPGILDLCRQAVDVFEDLGCAVEEAYPDFPMEEVWRAWLVLRAFHAGSKLRPYYDDPSTRKLLKPEAVFEVESGFKLSAFDIADASAVRAAWYASVARFFERYDYFVLPTAQLFPFPIEQHWPSTIAGVPMQTYHEWMKVTLPGSMAGGPCLSIPAGFNDASLPMGLQILGPNLGELGLLKLGHAYDEATKWPARRPPPLLGRGTGPDRLS